MEKIGYFLLDQIIQKEEDAIAQELIQLCFKHDAIINWWSQQTLTSTGQAILLVAELQTKRRAVEEELSKVHMKEQAVFAKREAFNLSFESQY